MLILHPNVAQAFRTRCQVLELTVISIKRYTRISNIFQWKIYEHFRPFSVTGAVQPHVFEISVGCHFPNEHFRKSLTTFKSSNG